MVFEVGNLIIKDGSIVQVWATFEDADDVDKEEHLSFTCSAKYSKSSIFAGDVFV